MTASKLHDMAHHYLRQGQARMARALAELGAKRDPDHVGTLNLLGILEFSAGNYGRAFEMLFKGLEKSRGRQIDQLTHNIRRKMNEVYKLGFDHLKEGRLPEALDAFGAPVIYPGYGWLSATATTYLVNRLEEPDLYEALCAHLAGVRWERVEQSFSQTGEDLMVIELLKTRPGAAERPKGIYVDIGAHHPLFLSVTAALHFMGWNGISIDPLPDAMAMFHLLRSGDVNLTCAIGKDDGEAYINVQGDPTLSFISDTPSDTGRAVPVPVRRIDGLLDEHLPAGRGIDVMNVDVEGGEEGVIDSNDWERYRPYVLLLEDPAPLVDGAEPGRKWRRMEALGYRFVAQVGHTAVYVDVMAG